MKAIGRFGLLLCLLVFGAAHASHQAVTHGLIVNLGVVSAAHAAGFPTEAGHGARPSSASQHVLISLSDAKSGEHVEGAKVSVRLTDPRGASQKKDLVLGRTNGIADYSEVFMFGWSGKYRIRVTVQPKDGKPFNVDFVWTHQIG